jgi:uncharacterized protein (DUF1330 family)
VKSNHKILVGVVAGVLAGFVGSSAIHGQQLKTPPAYVISEVNEITDPTSLKDEYLAKVHETLAPFDGHYHFLVRGGKAESLDGDATPKGIVVIQFESAEQAHAWYDSPAYAAISKIRQAATKGRMFIVEGPAVQ